MTDAKSLAEKWKQLDFDPRYEVSNLGRVRGPHGITSGSGGAKRYCHISINKKSYKVHRLVLHAFVGKSDLHTNHINGIKSDNRLVNLEYCTQAENNLHAIATGLRKGAPGSRNGCAKLNEKLAREIKAAEGDNVSLGKKYGVSDVTIGLIKRGKAWKKAFDTLAGGEK